MQQHPFFDPPKFRVIAHRGFVSPGSYIAENTRAAFTAAKALGADAIEIDCHVTSDGEIVVIHDSNLKRVTGESVSVKQLTLRELRSRFIDRGELLTLEEALEEFSEDRFNIDVKSFAAAVRSGEIIAPHAERVLLASFSERIRLTALAAATIPGRPGSPTTQPATSPSRTGVVQLLTTLAAGRDPAALLRRYDALQIPERQGPVKILTPKLLRAAHHAGVEVHVWTINDPLKMLKLRDMGVDAVITDRADLAPR